MSRRPIAYGVTIFRLAIVCGSLAVQSLAQEIPAPSLKPSPPTDAHRQIVHEGVVLHDRGDFDGAIRKYQEVLAESPDDMTALYELAFSLFAKGDYTRSLEAALAGARYDSPQLSGFYVLLGNNFDQLKQPEKAVKAYQAGIKRFPEEGQLRYNLAVTYVGMNRSEDAKKTFKESVRLDPNHPASHLGLSQVYQKENYPVPALMALARFLVLEPNSRRSPAALSRLREMMQSGVRKDSDKNITIFVNTEEKKDEGDFSGMSMMLSLLGASRHVDISKGKTDMQLTVEGLDGFFDLLSGTTADKKSSGFAWVYYRPYFIEMKRKDLVEPFCYHIHRSSNDPEVAEWLSKHGDRIDQFIAWSKSYVWKGDK